MITRDDSRYILPGDTRETAATTVAHFPYSSGNRNISHVAHRARTGPQRSWKSIRNNATSFFLGFRALSCRQIEGTEMFLSLARDYLGGQVESHVPSQLYLIILLLFFSSFKIFFRYVAQRALLIVNIVDKCFEAFQEDNGWLIVNWIESNRSRDGNSWVYKKNKHPPPVESFVKIKFDPISG